MSLESIMSLSRREKEELAAARLVDASYKVLRSIRRYSQHENAVSEDAMVDYEQRFLDRYEKLEAMTPTMPQATLILNALRHEVERLRPV